GVDACIPKVSSGACVVERVIAGRALSAREADEMLATFGSVQIGRQSLQSCESDDPCVLERFRWMNDLRHERVSTDASSGPCAPFVTDDAARDVAALLTRLL